ncbi:MAG: helix-turn-helix transcriptional regulator [Clostridia bacterium]|nr:helix-turn-helix transcriptional regulator [Clostridia bacterium]
MSVGANIRKYREAVKMTQQELADCVGVDQSMISQIERGTKIPTILLGKEIANALGRCLDDLIA